jgi:hypothetical protein
LISFNWLSMALINPAASYPKRVGVTSNIAFGCPYSWAATGGCTTCGQCYKTSYCRKL